MSYLALLSAVTYPRHVSQNSLDCEWDADDDFYANSEDAKFDGVWDGVIPTLMQRPRKDEKELPSEASRNLVISIENESIPSDDEYYYRFQ